MGVEGSGGVWGKEEGSESRVLPGCPGLGEHHLHFLLTLGKGPGASRYPSEGCHLGMQNLWQGEVLFVISGLRSSCRDVPSDVALVLKP